MWISTQRSFLHIVASKRYPGHLTVRARRAGDLQQLLGSDVKVEVDATQRYRFLATLPAAAVRSAVDVVLMEIDYATSRASDEPSLLPSFTRANHDV
jgi:hypothetical protein